MLSLLGVDSLDKITPEHVQQFAQREAQRLMSQQQDPLLTQQAAFDQLLGTTDPAEFAAQVIRNRQMTEMGFINENKVADEVASLEEDNVLTQFVTAQRNRLQEASAGIKTQIDARTAEQARVTREGQQKAEEFRVKMTQKVEAFRDPLGRPLLPEVQRALTEEYAYSGQLLKDLNARIGSLDQDFIFELATMLHPTYGKGFQQMREANLVKRGESNVLKEIDRGVVSTSAAGLPDPNGGKVSEEDFWDPLKFRPI